MGASRSAMRSWAWMNASLNSGVKSGLFSAPPYSSSTCSLAAEGEDGSGSGGLVVLGELRLELAFRLDARHDLSHLGVDARAIGRLARLDALLSLHERLLEVGSEQGVAGHAVVRRTRVRAVQVVRRGANRVAPAARWRAARTRGERADERDGADARGKRRSGEHPGYRAPEGVCRPRGPPGRQTSDDVPRVSGPALLMMS